MHTVWCRVGAAAGDQFGEYAARRHLRRAHFSRTVLEHLYLKEVSTQNCTCTGCIFRHAATFAYHWLVGDTHAMHTCAHTYACMFPYVHLHARICALLSHDPPTDSEARPPGGPGREHLGKELAVARYVASPMEKGTPDPNPNNLVSSLNNII